MVFPFQFVVLAVDILGLLAIAATIINLWYCYYERVENFFWNWPAYGLIAIGMFLNHAYANATMLIIQAGVSTYGFFIWTKRRSHGIRETLLSMVYDRHHKQHSYPSVIATSRMSLKFHLYSIVGIIATSACTYSVLNLLDDIAPLTDALSFSVLLMAAIQLNYKKIESWLYYVVGDLLSMILAYKAHNLYNFIAISLFVILNLICFNRWLKGMKNKNC